jgi:hypothetical protein
MGEMNENLALQSISIRNLQVIFTGHLILQHGASGFTAPPKEGMLQIFIALKNPSLWLGLNP